MEELKPCPFCGGEAAVNEAYGYSDACVYVACLNCNSSGSEFDLGYDDEAIAAWNTRAETDQDRCNLERLVQIGESVARKEPIRFLVGETYVPERTCNLIDRTNMFQADIGSLDTYWNFSCGHRMCGNQWEKPKYCVVCGAKVVE